jgi:hypothetical protein
MKSFFNLRENTQVTEAVRVSRKDFDKLKKGSMITIDYGSSIKGSTKRTFMVKSKTRSAKYNVDKVNMVDPQKPGGMKFHLYSRGGEDATLALGDMGATINSYSIKESVDEATILRTKTTRKQSDASKEKDRKKAVKTFQDIRKGKYPGVKIGEEALDEADILSKKPHPKGGHILKIRTASGQVVTRHLNKGKVKTLAVHKEDLDEASIQDIQGILTTIAKSQNMNQAVQMVVKKYKVDQGKAKAMVKKAIDSGVTYDKIKKKYAKESLDEKKSKGLWHNIHQKRKRGERPAKPGEEGYPKTLDVGEDMSKFSAKRPVSVKLRGKKVDVHQKDGKHHVSVDGKSLGSHGSQKAAMSAASKHIYGGVK